MSLAAVGTAANVLGLIMPAKDIGEIIKGIADSIQEVKSNEESTSYWDKTLKEHAKDVYSFMMRYKEAGANDSQTRSLMKLIESLIILRKEIIENSRRSYVAKLYASGDIKRKIEMVEKKVKQCHDLFVADTLSSHTGMLLQLSRKVCEVVDREGRNYSVERTAIRWKVPGKADGSDPLAVEYTYLTNKSYAFICELKSSSGYFQKLLSEAGHNFEAFGYRYIDYPKGNPLSECEDASTRIIRSYQMLRNRNLDHTSFSEWLIDNEELSVLLFDVGLIREARQIGGFMRQIWTSFAFRTGSAPVYSHLARSLRNLAADDTREGRPGDALPLVEQAIQIYRNLGKSFLPDLGGCLSDRSDYLRSLHRFEDALESAQESVGIMKRLVNEDLSLHGPQLVDSLRYQAATLLSLSKHEEALRCSKDALQWLSKLSPRNNQAHSFQNAWILWYIAISHHNLGDYKQAMEYGESATNVFHALIRDRPLYYTFTVFYTLDYSSWLDREAALLVLDKSLSVCLSVDTTFTAPQVANILDRRAAAFMSSSRFAEALESYDQSIDIRRRLLEDDEGNFEHFKSLIKMFRLRISCLLPLQRQRDVFSSLGAAQDAVVSRLKLEIDEDVMTFIIQELEEQYKLLEDLTDPDHIEAISSLKSCRKVLSQIHEIKCASQLQRVARQDFGMLSTIEYQIYHLLGKENMAQMSIQDAIDFYRSQSDQNVGSRNRNSLIRSLVSHARSCIRMDRLELALLSIKDAMGLLFVDSDEKFEGSISYFFEIFDFYAKNSKRLHYECASFQNLRLFSETAIGILRTAVMINHTRTKPALAYLLFDKARLSYDLGLYEDAISASGESVDIHRELVDGNKWQDKKLAVSLYWHAKYQLTTGDANTALKAVNDGINILIEGEDPSNISDPLRDLLFLQSDILSVLGRTPDVHDALLESLLLVIPFDSDMDSDSDSDYESDIVC